ncbi:hypothetical protein LIER_25636 [Lithospermum erythrorhizon]|uniref:Uncharacterized protein n=1 Tax=Lithospermum erythrorhizon TaxID=34254 RepID=A0AAV3R6T0_LITER
MHLCKNGFVKGYEIWEYHGEIDLSKEKDATQSRANILPKVDTTANEYADMVNDGFIGGLEFDRIDTSGGKDTLNVVEDPNPIVASYYKFLQSANEPLFDGCSEFTKLSMTSELLNLKSHRLNMNDGFQ